MNLLEMSNKEKYGKGMKLHHIGIIVKNIQTSLGELTEYLNFESTTIPSLIGSQKVRVCFLKLNNVYIELIEPAVEDSPVAEFAKNGGGFHHLCFEVKNIQMEVEKMKNNGARVIVEPVMGFEERLIAFLYINMKHTKCNLIELVETK